MPFWCFVGMLVFRWVMVGGLGLFWVLVYAVCLAAVTDGCW